MALDDKRRRSSPFCTVADTEEEEDEDISDEENTEAVARCSNESKSDRFVGSVKLWLLMAPRNSSLIFPTTEAEFPSRIELAVEASSFMNQGKADKSEFDD